jgi:hypothetical protein
MRAASFDRVLIAGAPWGELMMKNSKKSKFYTASSTVFRLDRVLIGLPTPWGMMPGSWSNTHA